MSQFKFVLPNVRKAFVPDPGYFIADSDLAQADAQVVAWEADDDILKEIFRNPDGDLHTANAEMVWGKSDNTKLNKERRQLAKAGCHLTNYGGKEHTCARALGITVKEAADFQRRWFDIHPGIKEWHNRIEDSLMADRTVRNQFGYSMTFFNRIENAFTEALAWIPQSTVALIISKAMIKSMQYSDVIQPLIQVHDSFIVQIPKPERTRGLRALHDCMHITVPYDDPLVIPAGVEVSDTSWGDVQEVAWPDAG